MKITIHTHCNVRGQNWESIDISWDAETKADETVEGLLEREAKKSDWSEINPGEEIRLVADDEDGEELARYEFTPNPETAEVIRGNCLQEAQDLHGEEPTALVM